MGRATKEGALVGEEKAPGLCVDQKVFVDVGPTIGLDPLQPCEKGCGIHGDESVNADVTHEGLSPGDSVGYLTVLFDFHPARAVIPVLSDVYVGEGPFTTGLRKILRA